MRRSPVLSPSARWLALPLLIAYPLWVAVDGVAGASAGFALGFALCAFPLAATLVDRGEGAAWLPENTTLQNSPPRTL